MAELFTYEKNIPQWLADYFDQANCANYPYKELFYKNIKHQVLISFGQENGYDHQTIERKCWSCDGRGRFFYNSGSWAECYNCNLGVHSKQTYTLKRYVLNGKLYHIPFWGTIDVSYKNKIAGKIVHPDIYSEEQGTRAYFILLWKYNNGLFYQTIKAALSTKVDEIIGLIKDLIRRDNQNNDLPF